MLAGLSSKEWIGWMRHFTGDDKPKQSEEDMMNVMASLPGAIRSS